MTTTTDYGTIKQLLGDLTPTLTACVLDTLGGEQRGHDVEAIVSALRDEINGALPEGVALRGEEMIYGPHPRLAWWADDDSDEWANLKAEIEAIDLDLIASRHSL